MKRTFRRLSWGGACLAAAPCSIMLVSMYLNGNVAAFIKLGALSVIVCTAMLLSPILHDKMFGG